VAEKLQKETGATGRGAKHCRERYFNHLDPNINHAEWTAEEDRILQEAYAEHGSAWTKIAKLLSGRTDNSIKNRWYCQARKNARKVNNSAATAVSEEEQSTIPTLSSSRTKKRSCVPRETATSMSNSDDEETVSPAECSISTEETQDRPSKRLSIDESDAEDEDEDDDVAYPIPLQALDESPLMLENLGVGVGGLGMGETHTLKSGESFYWRSPSRCGSSKNLHALANIPIQHSDSFYWRSPSRCGSSNNLNTMFDLMMNVL